MAVVVTKLTGALLFILLLSLVIVALVPRAADLASPGAASSADRVPPVVITTPETLPEAIAGRPYHLALAASGGHGPLRWSLDGELPAGLQFDPERGTITGTRTTGTPQPRALMARVSDGQDRATVPLSLVVYQSEAGLSLPSRWKPALPPIPWKAWLDQGFGFLVLLLVFLTGRNTVSNLERWSTSRLSSEEALRAIHRRFAVYRATVTLGAIGSAAWLALWLWRPWQAG